MKVKAVLSILAIAALTACGGGEMTATLSDTDTRPVLERPVADPVIEPVRREPIVDPIAEMPSQIIPPYPTTMICDATTYIPCSTPTVISIPPNLTFVLCDWRSYNPCANPTWIQLPPEPERVEVCDSPNGCASPAPAPEPLPVRNRT